MSDFKVGDRVRILPGPAPAFVGMDRTISAVRPHDRGIETMERHIVVFERREKRSFYGAELMRSPKSKTSHAATTFEAVDTRYNR